MYDFLVCLQTVSDLNGVVNNIRVYEIKVIKSRLRFTLACVSKLSNYSYIS